MYLTDIVIENAGPITKLDLSLPFTDNKAPKPVLLVGANGSGKTVVQATIADALILMATPHFDDVVPKQGLSHAYFKISGALNQRVGERYSLSLLAFEHGGKKASYIDQTGELPSSVLVATITQRFPGINLADKEQKKAVAGFDGETVQSICRRSSLCFFPSTRRELPHWLNVEAVHEKRDAEPVLTDVSRYSNRLGKPVFIERCREQNKRWILDVLFDSRTEIELTPQGACTPEYDSLENRLVLTIARNNINGLLQTVIGDPQVRVHANYRHQGSRLAIAKGANVIIPSLDHLSLGQSLLFNLFCTIARYADTFDITKGHQLNEIEGLVIIDEVDAHLHTELQFASLPKLIKLFPRIQFIISTHAPMFLLGMEKEFGSDGIAIFELPRGEQISTERFSEFKTSLDHYRQTKAFEDSVRDTMLTTTKPVVLLEGDTDRDYLFAYLRLSNRADLLASLNLDWAGNNVNGIAQGGGKGSLDTVAKVFRAKLGLLQKKLLLIHDCDNNKPKETLDGKLYIRAILQNPLNTKFRRGIENLLPESLARSEFYDTRIDDRYGGERQELNKRRLCDWVIAQNDASLFAAFQPLLGFLEEIAPPPQEAASA